MTYQDLIDAFGRSPSAIGRALGFSPQRVSYWRDKGEIPVAAQALIQIKTKSRLKADKPQEERASA